MNLNLGCGNFQLEDWINVDRSEICKPDVLHDLEVIPWPFESNSVDNIVLSHVLEHLGQEPSTFIKILKELYRIAKDGCFVHIDVPCPKSRYYLSDPTHVRPITPDLFDLFDKKQNKFYTGYNSAMSQLGIEYDVDFEVVKVDLTVDKVIYDRIGHFKYYNFDHELMSNAIILPNIDKEAYHELTGYNSNIIINMHILVRCNKLNDSN
jgi:SAM-dependent methyltransferase